MEVSSLMFSSYSTTTQLRYLYLNCFLPQVKATYCTSNSLPQWHNTVAGAFTADLRDRNMSTASLCSTDAVRNKQKLSDCTFCVSSNKPCSTKQVALLSGSVALCYNESSIGPVVYYSISK